MASRRERICAAIPCAMRALVIAIAAGAVLASPAGAAVGVGVDVAKIAVTNKLVPGVRYPLPLIGVTNKGDTTDTPFAMRMQPVQDQKALVPEPSWFSFKPARFKLDPKQTRKVKTTLTLPRDALPGKYVVLIAGYPDLSAQGMQVGAAAATKLSFEIVDNRSLPRKTTDWVARFGIWACLVLGGALAVLGVMALVLRRRRSQVPAQ